MTGEIGHGGDAWDLGFDHGAQWAMDERPCAPIDDYWRPPEADPRCRVDHSRLPLADEVGTGADCAACRYTDAFWDAASR